MNAQGLIMSSPLSQVRTEEVTHMKPEISHLVGKQEYQKSYEWKMVQAGKGIFEKDII